MVFSHVNLFVFFYFTSGWGKKEGKEKGERKNDIEIEKKNCWIVIYPKTKEKKHKKLVFPGCVFFLLICKWCVWMCVDGFFLCFSRPF